MHHTGRNPAGARAGVARPGALSDRGIPGHNETMTRPGLQISVASLLGLVACAAVNFWLFRVGFLYGLVGLNVTKHVGVAIFCQSIGVNRPSPGPRLSEASESRSRETGPARSATGAR